MKTIKELSNLSGRRALITGAAGNLGKMIASTLAELGANLVLVDREGTELFTLIDALKRQWGVNIECKYCDLEHEKERLQLIDWLKSETTPLNILINNAAFVGTTDLKGWAVPFEQQTIEAWNRALEVNLTAAFHLCQSLTSKLIISEGASIINIASIYGVYGPDWSLYEGTKMANPAAYSVSKAGLIQLTRWLSSTLCPTVRVNSISPGGIFRDQPNDFVERYKKRTPLGRMATEEDLMGAIVYLSTDLSKYVTGQNLLVDGGWGML